MKNLPVFTNKIGIYQNIQVSGAKFVTETFKFWGQICFCGTKNEFNFFWKHLVVVQNLVNFSTTSSI